MSKQVLVNNESPVHLWYVTDQFGKESRHFALSEQTAIEAHKVHHFGREGAMKKYKVPARATEVTSIFSKAGVCNDDACILSTKVPIDMYKRTYAELDTKV